jgi:hypothetical protein
MAEYKTAKYQEDAQGNKKIIVKTDPETDQQKVSCGCCDDCGLEVRSVTASLSHVGYLPFTCEASEPPPTDTRYLKYRASGDGYIEACVGAPQHQNVTQEWEVDPFTGLTCYNGLPSEIISNGCSDLFDCSQTQKFYSCALNTYDSCTSAQEVGEINWTESLQDSYTIEDVANNVDTVLGRINPYGNDGMPAGTRGSVVNGTNGSILTWVNECALNRAEYISGAGGVTKTKLFVKFTKDTQYTLTQSNGSVQTLTATEGQQIIVETPSEPNAWTDIAIINKTKAGCCNSSIVATTHTGQTTDSIFVPDEDAPPPPIPFIGPDCKKYLTIYTTISSSYTDSGGGSSNQTFSDGSTNNSEYGYTISDSYQSTSTINAGQEPSVTEFYTIATSKTVIDNNTTYSYSEELEDYYKSNEYTSTENCTSSNNETGEIITTTNTTQETIFYEDGSSDSGDKQTSTGTGSGTCSSSGVIWGSVPSDIAGCPNYEWVDSWSNYEVGTTTYNRNVIYSKKTEISGAVDSSTITVNRTETGTSTEESSDSGENYNSTASDFASGIQVYTTVTTYSNPYLGPDDLGTWKVETSPNESLCASRTESETTKQSNNVAASVELTFTAPASELPITYEHWFHYYTVEADSSEEGCPTSDVVAHNEKWTSVSRGGVLTLSRNINLSTPPKDHSICAQSPAFVTRVAS